MKMTETEGFLLRKNQVWAQLVMIALAALIGTYLGAIFINYELYSLLSAHKLGFGYDEKTAAIESILIQIETPLSILNIFLFLIWFWRVYANLHILKTNQLQFSKHWSIGGWFFPLINLFRPFEVMKEIWIETQQLADKKTHVKRYFLVSWWWAFFILRVVSFILIEISRLEESDVEGIRTIYFMLICSYVLSTIAAVLAISVVFQINFFEKRLLKSLKGIDIYDHLIEK